MRFLLYSRPGCGLCEEMLEELASLPSARGVPIDVVDVDLDPATRARYGLNPEEVDKTLSFHRRPV